MKSRMFFLAAASIWAWGCGSGPSPADEAVGGIVSDTATLQAAEAAANQVIRAVGDCSAVNAAYSEAMAKLDEAESQVQTQAGRTTIATLRKQVQTAGEACGSR